MIRTLSAEHGNNTDLKREATKVGLVVNLSETKHMLIATGLVYEEVS